MSDSAIPTAADLNALIEQAVRAPSVLNSQPWRFAVDGFDLTQASLDLYGPAFRDPPPGVRPWAHPVRLRYTLFQTADPGE